MNNKEFEKINKEVLETVETNKKRNINVELHKKINERGEGYYFKKQFKKIKLDIEMKYKNIKAVNQINNGEIPENPVTEISRSINSRNAAKDFAIRLLGREPTMEEWMRGNKIKINGKFVIIVGLLVKREEQLLIDHQVGQVVELQIMLLQ